MKACRPPSQPWCAWSPSRPNIDHDDCPPAGDGSSPEGRYIGLMSPDASTLLLFQPRTAHGSALAFAVSEVSSPSGLRTFASGLFAEHRTAVSIEVYDDDKLLCTLDRADVAPGAVDAGRVTAEAIIPAIVPGASNVGASNDGTPAVIEKI